MLPRTLLAATTWATVGSLLGVSIASGQPEPTSAFGEVVDVRVVNLEVVVTDKQGNRVSGLTPDDFELRLDGTVVPIEYFSEIADGVLSAHPDEAVATPGGFVAGEAVSTSYLVFIDEYFSVTRDRDRMIDRLIEQVPQLGAQDRMAVVRYDGRDLERLGGWSRGEELVTALRSAKGHKGQGFRRVLEQRSALSPNEVELLQRQLAREDARLSLEERYVIDRLESQLERVVRAAVSTMRSFAAPPGRKAMILLAGGWPFDPVDYIVDDISRGLFESSRGRFGEIYDPLRDTANLLGYTLYPVDVPGFQTQAISADSDFSRVGQGPGTRSFFRETGLHRTLQFLAAETGGTAILNAKRDRLLETAIEDTRSYYWLGFSPDRSGDDQRHDIEVLVKRPELRVRSRNDFFDFSRQREVTLAVESALYFGTPPSEVPLGVKLGRGKRSGLRSMVAPLEIMIPASEITILPGPGGFVGQLELRVAVLDEDGATTDTPVIPLALQLTERPDEGAMLGYSTKLKLRRKRQTIVVAVYDMATGAILSSSLEVDP